MKNREMEGEISSSIEFIVFISVLPAAVSCLPVSIVSNFLPDCVLLPHFSFFLYSLDGYTLDLNVRSVVADLVTIRSSPFSEAVAGFTSFSLQSFREFY